MIPEWLNAAEVDGGCWVWLGAKNAKGYGVKHLPAAHTKTGWTTTMAHRWVYVLTVGEIPEGHQVDHLCHNTTCVNPDHLEAVTPEENMRRRSARRQHGVYRTECSNGHPMAGDNLYVWTGPRSDTNARQLRTMRACLTCAAAYRDRVAAHKAGAA